MKLWNALSAILTAAIIAAGVASTTPAEAGNWEGAYVGAQVGFAQQPYAYSDTDPVLGVQAGYDWQHGNFVVGVGVDTLQGNIQSDFGSLGPLSRVKMRAGVDMGDFLLYGTLGASYATSHHLGNDWGYSAGVGVEYKLSDNWSVAGEITNHRFDDFRGMGSMDVNTATISVNMRF